ncbi:MAG TPA: glycosyltransferase family 4 protein [Polyangiaceae bacterium]|nr:glycosyltransferase family 4 protein [Polyangiaceae bacterium]
MRRILIVAGLAESLVRFRGDLIQSLLARAIEVHVVAPCGVQPRSWETLRSWGVVLHQMSLDRTGLNPAGDMRVIAELYRLLRRTRPTYLLAYTAKPVVYGLLAARLAGIQRTTALITGLGYAFSPESGIRRRVIRHLLESMYGFALGGAHRVVFQNPDDMRLFLDLGLAKPEQCGLVNGSGVNLEKFPDTALPPLGSSMRFVLVARLIRDKGIYEFAEAARSVKHMCPETEFHLVGGHDSNPAAISRAALEQWIAEGSITYHGQLEDVRPVLAQSHVFVLPSYYREGIPRTVLEAMAMGRPIITTDAPGCRETVVQGQNGYLVPVRDSGALASAMLHFVERPELIQIMGTASREMAVRKYDVAKVNSAMLAHIGVDG